MNNEELVEQIYNVLVERFGVGEVFLKKYRKTRLKDITWKEFIKAALELEVHKDLASYCAYSTTDNFSEATRIRFPSITKDKSRRLWYSYFYSLVGKKRCLCCRLILPYEDFNLSSSSKDGCQTTCIYCAHEYYQENKESILLAQKKRYIESKETVLEQKKKYRQANRESIALSSRLYYLSNKDSILSKNKEYALKHPAETKARLAKYRASKLKATPKWADQEAIKLIYATVPEGWHVDHIVPLQGKLVCGLHCEFNLQHLSAQANLSKGNKHEP